MHCSTPWRLGAALAGLLLAAPVQAQPSPFYDIVREAGANPAAAAGLSEAMRASVQEAKLVAADIDRFDQFGGSVSISGDRALVGATGESSNRGAAYVFVRSGSTWTQEAKLVAADAALDDAFGVSVSLSGDRALIGANQDDDGGDRTGSAYVFVRSGSVWTQEAKLAAADPGAEDGFGISVSLSGDRALVGAEGDDDAGTNSGSAYVFARSGSAWTREAKLVATDAAAGDQFGASVSLSGDRALVGAIFADDGGPRSGSAYVFARSGSAWAQEAKLVAADAAAEDYFGGSVSLSGDRALVGAYLDDDVVANRGSAYVFARSGATWAQTDKLVADDAGVGDQFGRAVSLSGDRALVGARLDSDEGGGAGSAYVFAALGGVSNEDGAEARVALAAPQPNPMRASAQIGFSLAETAAVRLTVFDLLGREVAVLVDGDRTAGDHTEALDASRFAPGVYVIRLVAGTEARTQRIVVVR